MRYLAIDLGDSRTGLAVGDNELHMAHPICVLEIPIGPRLVKSIVNAIDVHEVDELVLGLPLNMDGSEGQRVAITKKFANQLHAAMDICIHLQDERLTSAAAEEQLAGSGKTHKQKKKSRDAIAAATILQDYLDRNPSRR